MEADEMVPVRLAVEAVVPTPGHGRLVAMARVAVEIGGVHLLLQGVQVRRLADGRLQCHVPCFRDVGGEWARAIILPSELADALGAEVLEVVR